MKNQVEKDYYCPLCKKNHRIKIPRTLIENREHFPVTYFSLHKYQGSDRHDPKKVDMDILSSLFIDQKFHIRGVEAYFLDPAENIIAQKDAEQMISFLTNHIIELQDRNEELLDKYNELKTRL